VQLENCLKRLMSCNLDNVSVIVADSAPLSDAARSISKAYAAGYVLSPLKGLSRARNIGTRALMTDVVAYLDDDMIPCDCWSTTILKAFSDMKVMAVTGPILATQLADASLADMRQAVAASSWGISPKSVDRSCVDWFERTNFGGIGDGNFALRRVAFDEIDGFDNRLGRGAQINSGEEHYAYFRLALSGHRIAYLPDAIVFHPSSTNDEEHQRRYIQEVSAYLPFLAWNHPSYSLRILKYIVEGAFGKNRPWRQNSTSTMPKIGMSSYIWSGLIGLSTFMKSVLTHSEGK
jgi:hypothetical protein